MATAEFHEPTAPVSDWRALFTDEYWLEQVGQVTVSERRPSNNGLGGGKVNRLTADVFDRNIRKAMNGQLEYTELPAGAPLDLGGMPAGALLLFDVETRTLLDGSTVIKHQGEEAVRLDTDYPAQILNAVNSDPEELIHRATTRSQPRRERGVYGPAEYVCREAFASPETDDVNFEQYTRSAWFGMVVYVNQQPRMVSYEFAGQDEPTGDCSKHHLDALEYIHKHAAVGEVTQASHKEGAPSDVTFPLEYQRLLGVKVYQEPAQEWQAAYNEARGGLLGRFTVSEAYRQPPQVVPVS